MADNSSGQTATARPQREEIRAMFDDIAPTYDFLNSFLSLWIHKRWKRKLVRAMKPYAPGQILDLATGTGDLAILEATLMPEQVTAIDLSAGMLNVARKKVAGKKAEKFITFMQADALDLPFHDHQFDAATIGFGIRNFENPLAGLKEIRRVLKPGGVLLILEFSQPNKGWTARLFNFYFRSILPAIGRLFSRHPAAYTYLPDSVSRFPSGKVFLDLLNEAGFQETSYKSLSQGIACLYKAGR